jgi:hypothetical protein
MKTLWTWLLCRLLRRHTPFQKVSAPKEIGVNEWWVEMSGTCARCGTWGRRRERVPAPPCDHVFPHVCADPVCRAAAEMIWEGAGSVRRLGVGVAEEEPTEDELIDLESGVKK